jgi:phage gp45-like
MIRAILQGIADGVVRLFSAKAAGGETFAQREFVQHYGFASIPQDGAELFITARGNLVFCIASDDRRYRLALEQGEAALYDDLGQKVHLTRNGIVMKSDIKVIVDTPDLECTGNITAAGNVSDSKGSMDEMRDTYNSHTQPVSGGVAGAPTARMT